MVANSVAAHFAAEAASALLAAVHGHPGWHHSKDAAAFPAPKELVVAQIAESPVSGADAHARSAGPISPAMRHAFLAPEDAVAVAAVAVVVFAVAAASAVVAHAVVAAVAPLDTNSAAATPPVEAAYVLHAPALAAMQIQVQHVAATVAAALAMQIRLQRLRAVAFAEMQTRILHLHAVAAAGFPQVGQHLRAVVLAAFARAETARFASVAQRRRAIPNFANDY